MSVCWLGAFYVVTLFARNSLADHPELQEKLMRSFVGFSFVVDVRALSFPPSKMRLDATSVLSVRSPVDWKH